MNSAIYCNLNVPDEKLADNAVSSILDVVKDTANEADCTDLEECSKSVIFDFSEDEQKQFIQGVKDDSLDLDKYVSRAVTNMVKMLDMPLVNIALRVKAKGTYESAVTEYVLIMKPLFTPRDFLLACRKFMDHHAHCIDSVSINTDESADILVEINEST